MKRTILLLASICVCFSAQAQVKTDSVKAKVDSVKADSTVIRMGNNDQVTVIIRKGNEENVKNKSGKYAVKPFRFTALGNFDIGFTTFVDDGSLSLSTANSDLELEFNKSSNITLNLVTATVAIYKNYFRLRTGVAFDWQNYRFKNNITPIANQPNFTYITDVVSFNKNKLMAKYITIPVTFQYNAKGRRNVKGFLVEGGMDFGYLLYARTKQISTERGKVKVNDDFNFTPFKYGTIFKIGYGCAALYVKYYFNNIFEHDQPKLNNLSFGLSLSGF
ncbi:outer membrane beta-barrel protein [Solitalea koreensis]|uniref:Outer membrane protein beta-barrel domain-containing protein n=1 Tax=Solitalea koreensis TaxID=543615 RepID=A0A521ABI8_9SPHI|nr:outer membrane beta-barrel protein [Solitalea koreensis]SMO32090.1 Outer membrane protein beta-barrel domain-containing protein [Solitalea koreensis]